MFFEKGITMDVFATFWALLPPVIAIALALITKEVYSSLFIGIVSGALLYTGFDVVAAFEHIFYGTAEIDGETVIYGLIPQITDGWNAGILVFLVVLGTMVILMNRAGGSAAFGRWAITHVKTKVGAQLACVVLGVLIFVDDYFNCLTVGSVMRPLTDKHGISREKLAYLIDATAAPVCIIAPISSWAAAVTGFVDGVDGLTLFIHAIPYNLYALLTIAMMLMLAVMKFDFGPMELAERAARAGAVISEEDAEEAKANPNGRVIHLVLPIVLLIVCCVIGMIYTGGFFDGADFITAFSNCDASVGLAIGSFFGLVFTIVLYLVRRVLKFREIMSCIPEGFKAMVPAILILTFAWSLKAMTDSLGAKEYVEALVKASAGGLQNLLPAIIFLIGCLLAFATGTSWGTFGILIPIVVDAFAHDPQLMIIAISACMAGAVCGDHCSPISDTTIMASAGGQCDHVNHVSTQLPYAMVCAGVSCVTYIVAGFLRSAVVSLAVGIVLMLGTLFAIKMFQNDKKA